MSIFNSTERNYLSVSKKINKLEDKVEHLDVSKDNYEKKQRKYNLKIKNLKDEQKLYGMKLTRPEASSKTIKTNITYNKTKNVKSKHNHLLSFNKHVEK